MSQQAVVYIGEFDLRNENVQAHLVKNNGKLLKQLGYEVFYVGTNRKCTRFDEVDNLNKLQEYKDKYLELPHTLTTKGLFQVGQIEKKIVSFLKDVESKYHVVFVITYQAPTYASVLKRIALWCRHNNSAYIVNCADLPVFDSQTFLRRIVMNLKWNYMHRINKKYADGVISVSRYIENFYKKEGCPSVIIPPLFDEPELIEDTVEANEVPVFLYAGTPFVITGQEVNTKGMKDRLDKIVELMLKVESKGTSFCFQIVGITLEDYCRCVPTQKDALMGSTQIKFYGRKPHAETLKMLQQADYMINYRDSNLMTEAGMSTKVVESISVGTPVVINDIGDTFIYLKSGITGIKLTNSLSKNIDVIEEICSLSPNNRMSNKAYCRRERIFTIEKYIDSFDDFLKMVDARKQMDFQ
jgi:glycosyltransferase involved in cell wall biosynthesis